MKKKIIVFLLLVISVFPFISCKKNELPLNIKDCTNYNLNCYYEEDTKTLECEQNAKIFNNSSDEWNKLKFHLYPKAFSEGAVNPAVGVMYVNKAYPNGKSYGDITIESVITNNELIPYYQEGDDKDILVIELKDNLKQKCYVDVCIKFKVCLPNIEHRFGYSDNAINVANFYPILCVYENGSFSTNPYSINGDPFYSDIANYVVKLNYPSKYIMASSGIVLNEKTENDKTQVEIKAENVRDFAFILSEKFKTLSSEVDGIKINYYYYNDVNSDKSLKTCEDSVKTFNNLFGKYPYKELDVVETNFVYGGMEYPNMVMISDSINNYAEYVNTIVHEIAHQWWYGLVGNDAFTYGWLDEGLTEYSTALFYENNPSYEVDVEELIKNTTNSYLLFVQVYKDVFGNVDTTMTRKVNEYKTEPEYVYIAYVKGMLLMNDVRELIGIDNFLNGLKLYVKTYSGKNVTPNDFIDCMEKTSNQQLKSFVESYINGNVIIKQEN